MSKLISDQIDPDRSREVDTAAINNVREVYKTGITSHEVASFYDEWAENGVYDTVSIVFKLLPSVEYSRISISQTRIYRILRNSKRLSKSKIHFDCFLQP